MVTKPNPTDSDERSPELDSAGVYFISVEDFEARAKPKPSEPSGRDATSETPEELRADGADGKQSDPASPS